MDGETVVRLGVAGQAGGVSGGAPATADPGGWLRALGGQAGRILLVEDDAQLREMERRVLVRCGHQVDAVDNGLAGWDRLSRGGYDLVITDDCMPGMTGSEMVRRARERGLDLPVIMTSGFHGDPNGVLGVELRVAVMLEKPFQILELTEAVRALLDARRLVMGNGVGVPEAEGAGEAVG